MNIQEYFKSRNLIVYLNDDQLRDKILLAVEMYPTTKELKTDFIDQLNKKTDNLIEFSNLSSSDNSIIKHSFLPQYYYELIAYDVCIYQSDNEFERVLLSIEDKRFQLVKKIDKGRKSFLSKAYSIDDILGYDLSVDSVTIQSNGKNIGRMIVGGLLFGGAGAIAGALTGPKNTNSKAKDDYVVRLKLNDFELASVEIPCRDREMAYRLLATFELWESRINELDNK